MANNKTVRRQPEITRRIIEFADVSGFPDVSRRSIFIPKFYMDKVPAECRGLRELPPFEKDETPRGESIQTLRGAQGVTMREIPESAFFFGFSLVNAGIEEKKGGGLITTLVYGRGPSVRSLRPEITPAALLAIRHLYRRCWNFCHGWQNDETSGSIVLIGTTFSAEPLQALWIKDNSVFIRQLPQKR